MKKLMKTCISVVLVLSMLLSLGAVAFAAEAVEDITSSHVEFVPNADGTIYAQAFVRDYTGAARSATLILAVYEETEGGAKLVDAKKASGANAVLKTEAVDASAEGTILKAYVWQDNNMKVISEIANYSADFNDVLEGLEITFDGLDIKDDFVFNSGTGNYEYTKTYPIDSGEVTPKVTAAAKDNAANVSVLTDVDAKTTTITVEHGSYKVENGPLVNNSAQVTRPVYDNTRTYIINYETRDLDNQILVEDIDYIKDAAGGRLGAQRDLTNKYTYEAILEDGEEYKEINLSLNTAAFRTIVVVEPLEDGVDKVIGKAVIDSDGTVTSVESITETVDDYAGINASRKSYDAATGTTTYHQKSKDAVVTCNNETTDTSLSVYYDLQGTDYEYNTGSRFSTDRSAMNHYAMFSVPEAIEGLEFIPLPQGNTETLKFYITASAKIHVLSAEALTVTANGETVTKDAESFSGCFARYNNSWQRNTGYEDADYKQVFIAWLKYNGAVENVDYYVEKSTGNLYLIRHNLLGFECDSANYNNIYGFSVKDGKGNVLATSEIPCLWNDYVSPEDKGALKSVDEIEGLFSTNKAATLNGPQAAVSTPELLESTLPAEHVPTVTVFDSGDWTTDAGVYRMYSDRPNTHVGVLKSYSSIYGLKGAAMLNGYFDWATDSKAWTPTYRDADKRNAWYKFKVNQESEIFVFTNSANSKQVTSLDEAEGWIDISGVDGTFYIGGNAEKARSLAVKRADKDTEITIKTPLFTNESVHLYVIVKPIAE